MKEGEPYSERAIFFRSRDGGQTWLPREERRDIHGREFALTVLSDGSIIMPCHFLASDAFNESGHTYSKIFRSADHGKTWSETRIGPDPFPAQASTQSDWTAFEIPDPQRPGKRLVCIGVSTAQGRESAPQNVFLWQSRDGGQTWDKNLRPAYQGLDRRRRIFLPERDLRGRAESIAACCAGRSYGTPLENETPSGRESRRK